MVFLLISRGRRGPAKRAGDSLVIALPMRSEGRAARRSPPA
jgi:hypothetical protein